MLSCSARCNENQSTVRAIIIVRMDRDSQERDQRTTTWNDPRSIDRHRELSPAERIRLAIEASRAALRFAHGRRVDDR
jgi:hypothetical protein